MAEIRACKLPLGHFPRQTSSKLTRAALPDPRRKPPSEMRENLRPIRGIISRRVQVPNTDESLRDDEPARKDERKPANKDRRAQHGEVEPGRNAVHPAFPELVQRRVQDGRVIEHDPEAAAETNVRRGRAPEPLLGRGGEVVVPRCGVDAAVEEVQGPQDHSHEEPADVAEEVVRGPVLDVLDYQWGGVEVDALASWLVLSLVGALVCV